MVGWKWHQIPLTHPDWYQASNLVLMENSLSNGTVADLIDQDTKTWKVDLIRRLYHPHVAKEILLLPLSRLPNMDDKLT